MTIMILVAVLTIVVASVGWWIARMLYVCPPNQVLIFAGTMTRAGGEVRGYRAMTGGSALRRPLLERVFALDLDPLSLDLEIVSHAHNAVVVRVAARARLRLPAHEPRLGRAVECLLGKSRSQIADVARMVVRGSGAAVLAYLKPEEIDVDRERVAAQIVDESEHALSALGLELEALEIHDVSDEHGYLAAVRRAQQR